MKASIDCPLYGHKIIDDICFDISLVAEDSSPDDEAEEKIRQIPNFKEICLNCPNHRYD